MKNAGVSYFEGNSAKYGGAFDLFSAGKVVIIFSGDIVFKNNTTSIHYTRWSYLCIQFSTKLCGILWRYQLY